jgi:hypothetical protein
MRTSTLFSMIRSAVIFIALFLVGGAFGVTVTYYTDNNCGTKATSPFNGVPNPNVGSLNTCVKAMELPQGNQTRTIYSKATVCSASTFSVGAYYDNACTGSVLSTTTGKPGDCIKADPPPGTQSFKIECSAASNPASLMALILAFAFAAFCTQV